MIRIARPAVDPRIVPAFGATKDGQPLSYNRAPADDLAGWIARLSVTKLDLMPGYGLQCGLFTDMSVLRFQPYGDFRFDTATGSQDHARSGLLFGPNSRLMPVHVGGSFLSIGVWLRPRACTALLDVVVRDLVDKIVSVPPPVEDVLSLIDLEGSPEDWLQLIERRLREQMAAHIAVEPDPVTAQFEEIAFINPAISIAQAARDIGVDRRRLERLVNRDFGMSPKQVLKRARALDMASFLRGVADDDEGEALALRYYDESHLIHEFVELFGMSPRQFMTQPQPLLTLTLETRQARRLETIKRLEPGARRPWE